MNRILFQCSAAGCLVCILLFTGCGERAPREKTILEKLNSNDPVEQEKGLDEAEGKYGVKP